MRFGTIATIVASFISLAAAQSPAISSSAPVTTTITKTLLHYNQTVTSTSYSATGTLISANATHIKPTMTATGTAVIATFSTGAAPMEEVNFAIAAVAGLGAIVYGLY